MIKGIGRPVYEGVAIGRIFVHSKAHTVTNRKCADISRELELFNEAKEKARAELEELYDKTLREIGEEQAGIIEVQSLFLDDLDYIEGIEDMIKQGSNAAFSVHEIGDAQASAFAALDDEYMKARATDIRDISDRLIRILTGAEPGFRMEEPGIIVAEDLTPSETVALDKDKILAFVTRQGSSNSHTAILARVMNIPSLVLTDIDIDPQLNGRTMIVDGFAGNYYIDPDEETLAAMQDKKKRAGEYKAGLENYRGKPSVSKSGRCVKLFANIGSPDDIKYVIEGDAEGIGLLRSEFLYLGRDSFPTEDELFEAYRKVVEAMNGKKVVIRTLDIGADKKVDYFNLEKEENPALGYRGIRICLTQKDIFRTQLRAIYRASAYGTVAIMFPMIISVKEVEEIKSFCAQIAGELEAEGVRLNPVELGIMIETPAAAVISDLLAEHVDFFSVGTNDLTQYTLAIDRQNEKLDAFYEPHHEAIMRLLKLIAENAHRHGIWAGICGELAGDLSLTDEFLRMGYDELSAAPSRILQLRKNVIESEV